MRHPDYTLTAGPTTVWPRVQAALGQPVIYDYDPVFLERFRATERKLRDVYRTAGDVVLMQGEAVLGLEAAARGLVRAGDIAINLVSGVYGKWFGLWLRDLGAELVEVEVPYDEAVDPGELEAALRRHPGAKVVSVVHSETPSGTVNAVREIGPLAKRHGALVIADVVSSLGCEELRPDEWGLDVCVAGPQKSLAGPPGMSLVAVSDHAWAAMRANPDAPRGSFLSLLDWKERWIEGGRTAYPYTPSVAEMTGVEAALDEVLERGIDAYAAMHRRAAAATRAGVRAMGLELWAASEDIAARCVTAVAAPEGIDVLRVLAHVRERYGVMLSPGFGELKERLFRLGHMGPGAESMTPVVALAALGRGLADHGVPVAVGEGVDAALGVLAAEPVAAA